MAIQSRVATGSAVRAFRPVRAMVAPESAPRIDLAAIRPACELQGLEAPTSVQDFIDSVPVLTEAAGGHFRDEQATAAAVTALQSAESARVAAVARVGALEADVARLSVDCTEAQAEVRRLREELQLARSFYAIREQRARELMERLCEAIAQARTEVDAIAGA